MDKNKINLEVHREDVASFYIHFDSLEEAFDYVRKNVQKFMVEKGCEIGFDFTPSSYFHYDDTVIKKPV